MRVGFEERAGYDRRLIITCCTDEHRARGCCKSRDLRTDAAIFGRLAAQDYLRAWLSFADTMDCDDHNSMRVTRAQVRAFLDEHGPLA